MLIHQRVCRSLMMDDLFPRRAIYPCFDHGRCGQPWSDKDLSCALWMSMSIFAFGKSLYQLCWAVVWMCLDPHSTKLISCNRLYAFVLRGIAIVVLASCSFLSHPSNLPNWVKVPKPVNCLFASNPTSRCSLKPHSQMRIPHKLQVGHAFAPSLHARLSSLDLSQGYEATMRFWELVSWGGRGGEKI